MGTLFIVSTPIGNLEDITFRAVRTLLGADFIACEDTRRTGLLLTHLEKRLLPSMEHRETFKKPILIRFDEHTERNVTVQILHELDNGKDVAVVSDAGTPLLSDPGFMLVREAVKHACKVVSIPGPSALLCALTSSGLPAQSFLFLGYPAEKQSHRLSAFRNLVHISETISCTYILYCAPHKLIRTLTDMKTALGDYDIVLARELTKTYEELWRGRISSAMEHFHTPQGEFVLLWQSKMH